MKWSLEIPTGWPKFADEQLEVHDQILRLSAGEIGALRSGDSARHCEVTLEPQEATPALISTLESYGFFRAPGSTRMLLDLSPFPNLDAYLASLNRKHRQQIHQASARFEAIGGRRRTVPISSLSAREIDRAYDRVFLPAFSAKGINPYGRANSRSEFYRIIGRFASTTDAWATLLETNDGVVGFSIFGVAGFPAAEQATDDVAAHWHRDVSGDESMVEFVLAHGIPEIEEVVDLSALLYLECIALAFEQGATLWSPGRDRAPCVGAYLGVRAVKRKWGATVRVTVGPQRVFFRLSTKRILADNVDLEHGECDRNGLRQVFVLLDRSARNQLLVKKAAANGRVRVVALDEPDCAYWRNWVAADRDHDVVVQAMTIES